MLNGSSSLALRPADETKEKMGIVDPKLSALTRKEVRRLDSSSPRRQVVCHQAITNQGNPTLPSSLFIAKPLVDSYRFLRVFYPFIVEQ